MRCAGLHRSDRRPVDERAGHRRDQGRALHEGRDGVSGRGPRDTLHDHRCQCGQATFDEHSASAAKSFAGLSEGTRAALGYTVPAGYQTLVLPVIGSIKAELFTDASMVSPAEADVALCNITGAKWGQATSDGEYALAAKSSAGLSEGSCAMQAFVRVQCTSSLSRVCLVEGGLAP